jgi:tRNA(adenine34) deaminase
MKGEYEKYMQCCIDLAEIALTNGDPPVGAIIVYQNRIIGQGAESAKSSGDITNHAEIVAIKDAIINGHKIALADTVLFTTHEPCIMCSYVIRSYEIPKIVFGKSVPFIGGYSSPFKILTTGEVPKWGPLPIVIQNICLEKCIELSDLFLAKIK